MMMDHNEETQLYLRNPCLAWLDAVYESNLSSKAKLIAGVLASHMLGSDECWPGMALIAQRSSYAKRTVINAIAELVEAGWLVKKPGGMDRYGGTSPNRYSRLYPKQGNVVDLPSAPTTPPSEIGACTDITEGGNTVNGGGNQSSPPRGTSCPLNRNRNRKEIEKNIDTSKPTVSTPAEALKVVNKKKPDPVPYQQIVDLYHECLPGLPAVLKITKSRQGYMRNLWKDELKELDHWRNFFEYVGQSDFLMGRAQTQNGRRPFLANLEWITKPANFVKIKEEYYHNG